jgi:hypothetical protein
MDEMRGWQAVAEAVRRRLEQLPITKSQVVDRAGTDYRSFNKVVAGEEVTPAVRKKVARGLGWTPDSLDRIHRGESPIEGTNYLPGLDPPHPDGELELSASGVDLDELRQLDPETYDAIATQIRLALDRARERRQR